MVIVVILLAVALVVASVVLQGITLSYLWTWFVVPLGVKSIGIAWGVGLATLFHALHGYAYRKDDDEEGYRTIVVRLVGPLIALLFGYIVHLFM